MKKFPFYRQLDKMDCGPTCIKMIAQYYGKSYSLDTLRTKSSINREGVSMLGISDAAESIGFRTFTAAIPFDNLVKDVPLPVIVHWNQNHFIVVYRITSKHIYVADPAHGNTRIDYATFKKCWLSAKNNDVDTGLIMVLEPTADFYLGSGDDNNRKSFRYFLNYLKPYKSLFLQLYTGLIIGTLLSLIFPFLSQSLIDIGIANNNLSFIHLILISQLVLQTSSMIVGYIRGWIMLHIGTRISISIISDFIAKLLRLPIGFFENKTMGDLLQRIGDHSRVQTFLTSSSINLLFSLFDFITFGAILLYYSPTIFLLFVLGNILYVGWTLIFFGKRKALDYKHFAQASANQNVMLQILGGAQEIKLQGCEKKKRWEWERVQTQQFRLSMESLALSQQQHAGSFFVDQVKNIFISYFSARAVISGEMTLGMMLSISYILGQLNGPVSQLLDLLMSYQDAKISLERLAEIHGKDNEDEADTYDETLDLPDDRSIYINNLSFQYGGPHSQPVLKNINLVIEEGRKTAIVGTSGSGKTTLLKLLLKYYMPISGNIKIGNTDMQHINTRYWRSLCGIVAQDGYIFSDTIANNIAISDDTVDRKKLLHAVEVANIKEFIDSLPLKYNTRLGLEGNGISQGQRQRMLIARAVYKDPDFLFLDEATNALDAHNEKAIVEHMEQFMTNKTVVVVAHRLSTVRSADKIVVLEKGEIIETGNHEELILKRGAYYELIKNQLELAH